MKRMGKNINDKIVDFPKERQESIEKRFQQLKSERIKNDEQKQKDVD
jgi:hypothetical protein